MNINIQDRQLGKVKESQGVIHSKKVQLKVKLGNLKYIKN